MQASPLLRLRTVHADVRVQCVAIVLGPVVAITGIHDHAVLGWIRVTELPRPNRGIFPVRVMRARLQRFTARPFVHAYAEILDLW